MFRLGDFLARQARQQTGKLDASDQVIGFDNFGGRERHVGGDGIARVQHDRPPARALDRVEAESAIATAAAQHDANGAPAISRRDRAE